MTSFSLDKHSATRLTLSYTPSFKTWLRLTRAETFCMTTQTRTDTIQLTLILWKDKKKKYTHGVFHGVSWSILQINYPQLFYPSQPCSSPMWIQVKSLDHISLRFISPRTATENFSTLTDYLRSIMLEHLLVFLTIILRSGILTRWYCKAWKEKFAGIIACIMLYFAVAMLA